MRWICELICLLALLVLTLGLALGLASGVASSAAQLSLATSSAAGERERAQNFAISDLKNDLKNDPAAGDHMPAELGDLGITALSDAGQELLAGDPDEIASGGTHDEDVDMPSGSLEDNDEDTEFDSELWTASEDALRVPSGIKQDLHVAIAAVASGHRVLPDQPPRS